MRETKQIGDAANGEDGYVLQTTGERRAGGMQLSWQIQERGGGGTAIARAGQAGDPEGLANAAGSVQYAYEAAAKPDNTRRRTRWAQLR